ncbi:hypothetical protein RKE29_10320 [Streptomyces sp. B1866]|uniref:hypothetical protein n=1 Tax=Streptomyces sp. B1866 TaxID=3075431 RepID=UPI0028911DBE|nr:hypothetical protein [Streptomyces sp. B1866]MDT3397034.1 hypothetical protein [Streptomyces sp. B1866]
MAGTDRTRNPLVITAAVLAVAAAGSAVWTGVSWYAAAHDDDASYAQTRDEVLAAGEQAIQNVNTLDARDVNRDLDRWVESSTGDLRKQFEQGREKFATEFKESGAVTTAQVLSGAVTELDDRAGRASVMVALRRTVDPAKGDPVNKDSRVLGELTRTSTGWKLSAVGDAPIGDSAAGSGQPSAGPSDE